MTEAEWDALKQKMQDELLMTTHEAREPHVSIPAAELDRLRAELAECRRLLRKYEFAGSYCLSCGTVFYQPHLHDCAWQKAMGEQ
jgi:hypothetical protein